MKKILNTLLALILVNGALFGQATTPETIAREKSAKIKNSAAGVTNTMLREAYIANTDLAAIKVPYVTQAGLRTGKADTAQVVQVIHPVSKQAYVFRYNAANTTSLDDSATVIRYGNRRYEIQVATYEPEIWGAIADDNLDDYAPMQRMLNYINVRANAQKRSWVMFRAGAYDISNTLTVKQGTNGAYYVTLQGAGEGRTTIKGITATISGKDLISMPCTINNINSYFYLKNMTLAANGANTCFNSNRIYGAKFEDTMFFGGELACLHLGTYGTAEGYSNYITRCYLNGVTMNGGSNAALIENHQTRFTVIRDIETDGGYYGIDSYGSDKVSIVGGKIEGSKRAAIVIRGSYGGESRISDVYINPYVGDRNAQYDGTLNGIEIVGLGFNQVTANRIFLPSVDTTTRALWNYASIVGPLNFTNTVTGATSGTTAVPYGWNVPGKRVFFTTLSGSGFVAGEVLTQATTGATITLGARIQIKPTVGIKNTGSENTFTGNIITGDPNVGFDNTGTFTGTLVTGNLIAGSQVGMNASGTMMITGNRIYAPSGKTSFVKGSSTVQGAGNEFGAGISTDWPLPTWNTGGALNVKSIMNLYGGTSLSLFGSDQTSSTTRTDGTSKTFYMGIPHVTNAEEPGGIMYVSSSATNNTLRLGGGISNFNAMTQISGWTSANTITTVGTERFRVWGANGGFQIQPAGGTYTEIPAAALAVTSTTQGFLPPVMTTTQRDAITPLVKGLMIINSTTNQINYYNGTIWKAVTTDP